MAKELVPLKWIFPTTGHAGSTFLCKALLRAGYKCGHEDVYQAIREQISLVREPAVITMQRGYQAESSVFCVPYLKTRFLREVPCYHIVREPWKVVRSWEMSLGGIGISAFFERWCDIYDVWEWPGVRLYGADTRDQTWLAAMCVAWNSLTRRLRPESPICKIEESDKLFDMLGVTVDDPPSKKTNSKVDHDEPWSLKIEHDGVRESFNRWTEEAGYDPGNWF